jgi:peptidyl-prolyl cis-trans isomerase C
MRLSLSLNDLGRIAPTGAWRWLTLAMAALVAVGSGLVLATSSAEELPPGSVMRVNDRLVTEDQLQSRVASLEALYSVVPPEGGDELDEFRRSAAKSLAVSMIIEDAAADREIIISAKQAEAELAKIISDQLGGDRAQFVEYLGTVGLSETQVLDEIERTLATSRLYEDVTKDVPASTSQEARAEYDGRRDEMRTPERRRLGNIVVESQADANRVVALLGRGSTFEELVDRFSLDRSTRGKGGDLGTRTADELEPTYAGAAFAAAEGSVFGPVQTQYGWNVGRVVSVVPGDPLAFAEVEQTLVQALTAKAQLEAWRDWMRSAIEDADVVYDPTYLPDDPDGLPSDVEEPVPAQSGGTP